MTTKERLALEVLGVYVERLLSFGIVHPTSEQLDNVCDGVAYIVEHTPNKSKKAIDRLKRCSVKGLKV